MSDAIFNRASKNFDKYLKAFQQDGTVYMLPVERLSTSEWAELNRVLEKYGVRMVPEQKNGLSYMKFSALPNQGPTVKADADLGAKLKRYTGLEWQHKTANGSGLGYEHYRIKIDDMTQSQVQRMIDELDRNAIYDANPVYTNKGQFLVVKVPDPVLESIFGYYKTVNINGVPAYIYNCNGIGRAAAKVRAEKLQSNGEYYATTLNKTGDVGADYIVIAIKKTDAKLLGAKYENDILSLPRKNTEQMQRMKNIIGQPLTHINGVPAVIESIDDFGIACNRPIILVSVGGKKLPFYLSSGTAGKTEVPTGKWEFFGGITKNDWFRKGSLEEIKNHYNSPALKSIASALDARIGDLRDTVDILKTIGRQELGGVGIVARAMHGPNIEYTKINQDVFLPDNDGLFPLDVRDIKRYLQDLKPGKDKAQGLKQGGGKLRAKLGKVLNIIKKERDQ